MSRLLATSRRLAFAVAAIALTAGLTAGARADVAYAFATETITGIRATDAAGNPDTNVVLTSPITVGSLNSATLTGFTGVVNGDGPDAPQAYVGTPPPAPENFFQKYATFAVNPVPPLGQAAGALPTGISNVTGTGSPAVPPFTFGIPLAAGSFSRGDEQANTATATGSVVAESLLFHQGGEAHAQGSNDINVTFRVNTTGTSNITFGYANDAYAVVNANGDTAKATYKFNITIADKTVGNTFNGGSDFSVSPSQVNLSLSSNGPSTNGPEVIRSGTLTIAVPTLTAGDVYSLTFTLNANTDVTTAVPEPATMAMALTALPLLGFGLLRRRNRNRKVLA